MTTGRTWRRSTKCAADKPQCVEVSVEPTPAVRDSKNPEEEVILTFPARNFARFVNALVG